MTREQHYAEYQRLNAMAREHLNNSIENGFNRPEYLKYRETMKLANKHHGIAAAMWTRSIKKLYGSASI